MRFTSCTRRCTIAATTAVALLGAGLSLPTIAWADDAAPQTTITNTADSSADDTSQILTNPQHMWNQDSAATEDDANDGIDAQAANGSSTWTTADGMKTFVQGDGVPFASPAMKVIDVSEWQGNVNWNSVKASGIDGVILRVGYCNNLDQKFAANLAAVRKAGIPYGIYLYSYAPNAYWANVEANFVAQQIKNYAMTDMTFPVYYDLEAWNSWTWDGQRLSHPTTPSGYLPVVNTFTNTMRNNGVTNVQIYSYLSYLNNELNDASIHAKAGWVAQYNTICDYAFPNYSGQRGWQYTSAGSVNGISGNVDTNVFDKPVFRDTNFRTPHYSDIMWLNQYGITTGFADKTFRGSSTVVRQDMAAFLRREAAKRRISDAATWKPSAADWNRFTDVRQGSAHAEDILWLAHAGIAEGYKQADGTYTFGGMTPVYRQDMAAFIKRLADKAGKSSGVRPRTDFTDVTDSTPHAAEVRWLGGSGIADGWSDGTFRPGATVIRQDMAAFLHRLDTLLA